MLFVWRFQQLHFLFESMLVFFVLTPDPEELESGPLKAPSPPRTIHFPVAAPSVSESVFGHFQNDLSLPPNQYLPSNALQYFGHLMAAHKFYRLQCPAMLEY